MDGKIALRDGGGPMDGKIALRDGGGPLDVFLASNGCLRALF